MALFCLHHIRYVKRHFTFRATGYRSEFWKQQFHWLVERSVWDDPQMDVIRSKQRSETVGSDFNETVKCNRMQLTRKWIKKIHASYTLEGTVLENIDSSGMTDHWLKSKISWLQSDFE